MAAVALGPFAQPAAKVVAVPKTAVKDSCQPLFPLRYAVGRVGAVGDGLDGFAVAFRHGAHIVGAAAAAFDFQNAHARIDDFVEEVNGTQVFGRHNVFVVDHQLGVALEVLDQILAAAQLQAGAAVGAVARVVEREVAFAAHRHTERAVGENLDLHQLALGPADVVLADKVGDFLHLAQRQLAGGDHHVGKLGIEAHGLDVADVALGRDVHLDADAAGVGDDGQVAGDDGADADALGGVDQAVHLVDFVIIYYCIDRQVGANVGAVRYVADALQVVEREIGRRTAAHIQVADSEIDGVGSALYRRRQAFIRAHGGHYFYFVLHNLIVKIQTAFLLPDKWITARARFYCPKTDRDRKDFSSHSHWHFLYRSYIVLISFLYFYIGTI